MLRLRESLLTLGAGVLLLPNVSFYVSSGFLTWKKSFQTGLLPFAGKYLHNVTFSKTEWLCHCRDLIEDEGHIISGKCEVYKDVQTQFGVSGNEKNVVSFFQAVLDRRDDMKKEDRT